MWGGSAQHLFLALTCFNLGALFQLQFEFAVSGCGENDLRLLDFPDRAYSLGCPPLYQLSLIRITVPPLESLLRTVGI